MEHLAHQCNGQTDRLTDRHDCSRIAFAQRRGFRREMVLAGNWEIGTLGGNFMVGNVNVGGKEVVNDVTVKPTIVDMTPVL